LLQQNEKRCLRVSKIKDFGVFKFFFQRHCGCGKSARATEPKRCQWKIQRGGERESHKQQGALQAATVAPIAFLARRGCVATAAVLVTFAVKSDVQRTKGCGAKTYKSLIKLTTRCLPPRRSFLSRVL